MCVYSNIRTDELLVFLCYYYYSTVSYSGVNVNSMTIQSSRNTCIQVSVVQHNETLIVMYKKGPHSAKNIVAIKDCVTMLRNGTPIFIY